ncbi:DUF6952 family protein [Xanthovirga aplysinae]|uniref:DUF6952 family protein n=1 Tax=Xanthovirga aplysinae TaxID=2529853 RepID=UPI0012BC32FE|nr:hypothetical protein [Xanthovirga aplysinae]MTI32683.1 hypothetical protein [Xanthovirga aplysinae]
MKIPVIKRLVESYTLEELQKAEESLSEEQKPSIKIEGEDEGEQLTHVIAAMWIIEKMKNDHMEFKQALREYTSLVRKSIS